jgi:hypothetical protein
MTIAIGMLCDGGLIVAADTQMTWPDCTTYDAEKVQTLSSDSGAYVFAYSSENAEAAETLLEAIKRELSKKLISLQSVENALKEAMKKWNSSFIHREDRTDVSFIVGAVMKSASESDRLALFLCELPFTVKRKTIREDSGYIARGAGQVITDPLFRTLFGVQESPRMCLCRIAYLMYRAKKDCRGGCGGYTDAVFLRASDGELLWAERLNMAQAESFGHHLDVALAKTASFVIPEKTLEYPQPIHDFTADLELKGLAFQRLQFRAKTGEIIA